MASQKAPWHLDTRNKNLKKASTYIDAKESLVHGCNDDYLLKIDWVSTIIDGCT
jgi:hypothetical protein